MTKVGLSSFLPIACCSLYCPFLCVLVIGYWKFHYPSSKYQSHNSIEGMRGKFFVNFPRFAFCVYFLPQPFMMHKPNFFCVCFQLYIPIPNVSTMMQSDPWKFHIFCYSIYRRCSDATNIGRYMWREYIQHEHKKNTHIEAPALWCAYNAILSVWYSLRASTAKKSILNFIAFLLCMLNKIIIYVCNFFHIFLALFTSTPSQYIFYNILTLNSRALLTFHDRAMCAHFHIYSRILGCSFISLFILFRSTNFLSRLFIFDLRMKIVNIFTREIWMTGWKKAPLLIVLNPPTYLKNFHYREELK